MFFGYQVVTYSWRPDFRTVTTNIEKYGNQEDTLLLFYPDKSSFLTAGFHHYYKSNIPVTYVYEADANSNTLNTATQHIEPYINGIWILQVSKVNKIDEQLPNFELVMQNTYKTRFFYYNQSIGLAYLKRKGSNVQTD